jgi:UDP-N-acetylglucosamine transferase subunit ALG13
MIFVITGTESFPFNRFIKEIDALKKNNSIKDSVFVQLGSCSYEPEHCSWKRFLSFGEMSEHIQKASLVIAHAGAGTTLLCLQLGKRPLLVTRKKKYGEHLDDHQVPFAQNMKKLGYAVVAYEIDEIAGCLKEFNDPSSHISQIKKDNSVLLRYLDAYIQ